MRSAYRYDTDGQRIRDDGNSRDVSEIGFYNLLKNINSLAKRLQGLNMRLNGLEVSQTEDSKEIEDKLE